MAADIRVMLVDDHEVVREGLRALLNRRPGMNVVGEAGTVAEAIEIAARTRPDVIVMDVRLPDGSGVEACREICQVRPETRTIMLTSFPDEEALMASMMAGASAYFLKQTRGHQLAEAIEAVARGESLLDPVVMQRVLNRMQSLAGSRDGSKDTQLNESEQNILHLIGEGKTNKEIGAELSLSDKTVSNHVSNILSKLGLRPRSELPTNVVHRDALG